ncbi:hypothetical protein AK830_g9177 [Neonectria ditissima]|uniref:Uncharacterized protein n=1 Tax=Neonectria ditissima TaxID=78410 RepID=A0A0P7BAE1_9HYPO|nr:hypothetical protein AK830_g9177 [Neonectria ditissima]
MRGIVTSDGRESAPFTFSSGDKVFDDKLQLRFRFCTKYCWHFDEEAFGCHAECLAFASRLQTPVVDLFPATEYSYEPAVSDEDRRRKHIRHVVSQSLYQVYGKLPLELWLMVAAHLVPVYAVTSLFTAPQSSICKIDASRDVWATYLDVDGVEYVKTISNRRCLGGQLIWEAMPLSVSGFFYVLEDHFGIRRVTRDPPIPQLPSESDKSTWWRTISLSQRDVEFTTDGFKLRGLDMTWPNNALWLDPLPPSELKSLSFHPAAPRPGSKMISLGLNEPNIIGYSVCWSGSLIHLHANRLGESLEFYREIDAHHANPVWTFLPLNPGESITEVWQRKGRPPLEVALAFRTSQGRTMTTGPYPLRALKHLLRWSCVAKLPENTQGHMFFNHSASAVHTLAGPIQYPDGDRPGPSPRQTALSPYPHLPSAGSAFHSAASLRDVVEVVVSESVDEAQPRVTGLLLRYKNGNQASVGSFRFRQNAVRLSPSNSSGLFLGMGLGSDRWHVGKVQVSPPEDRTSFQWQEFPWDGTLEWWFRSDQCQVSHTSEAMQ